jgi:hypothetical protein
MVKFVLSRSTFFNFFSAAKGIFSDRTFATPLEASNSAIITSCIPLPKVKISINFKAPAWMTPPPPRNSCAFFKRHAVRIPRRNSPWRCTSSLKSGPRLAREIARLQRTLLNLAFFAKCSFSALSSGQSHVIPPPPPPPSPSRRKHARNSVALNHSQP